MEGELLVNHSSSSEEKCAYVLTLTEKYFSQLLAQLHVKFGINDRDSGL